METAKSDTSVSSDVLHIASQSKLSPEEIAKAMAHHKKHHHGDQPANAAPKMGSGKKKK
jgi:hypothetical protein